jgi:hypothetical protein
MGAILMAVNSPQRPLMNDSLESSVAASSIAFQYVLWHSSRGLELKSLLPR